MAFSEAYLKKVEEIPSQKVSSDFSVAESDRELAFAELLVRKLYPMGVCHDIRSRRRTEVNPLSPLPGRRPIAREIWPSKRDLSAPESR